MLERAKEVTRDGNYTGIEYARFADDLVILVDAYPRHDWLMTAVEKRLREELAALQVDRRVDFLFPPASVAILLKPDGQQHMSKKTKNRHTPQPLVRVRADRCQRRPQGFGEARCQGLPRPIHDQRLRAGQAAP
jgi:hypothetical protein